MKTYSYLWIALSVFFCQVSYSQSFTDNRSDPALQLRQSLQLPTVGLAMLKLPVKLGNPKMPELLGFNIAKNIAEAKEQCPFLKFAQTLQLEGERNSNEKVELRWETTNGYDNRAFDVDRSFGDTTHFEKINFVWGNEGVSTKQKYVLPDNNDNSEPSYYRLKLIYNDGKFVYSNIAVVKGYDDFLFSIYPNPTSNNLKINFSTKQKGSASIILYEASGRIVQQQSFFLAPGIELREINVARLSSGSYTLKMILPDKQIRIETFLKN